MTQPLIISYFEVMRKDNRPGSRQAGNVWWVRERLQRRRQNPKRIKPPKGQKETQQKKRRSLFEGANNHNKTKHIGWRFTIHESEHNVWV